MLMITSLSQVQQSLTVKGYDRAFYIIRDARDYCLRLSPVPVVPHYQSMTPGLTTHAYDND